MHSRVLPFSVHSSETKEEDGGVSELKDMLAKSTSASERAVLTRELELVHTFFVVFSYMQA